MKVSKMIEGLQGLKEQVGDVDVIITDGYEFRFYRGEFVLSIFEQPGESKTIDIGVGGCEVVDDSDYEGF